jgi:adenosylcobinamide-GDP ribazoletransferase
MVHGSTDRRIEVLKDKTLGMGAAGTLLMVYLISWSALAQLVSSHGGASLIFFMMAVEVSARFSLLLTAGFSNPSHPGSGSVFLAALKGQRLALAIAITLIILGILTVVIGPAAVGEVAAYTVLMALLVIVVAKHAFAGTGGDVLGASVELGRMAALLALITTF